MTRTRTRSIRLVSALLLLAGTAATQPARPPATAAPGAEPSELEPKLPEVDDPMLAEVPAAPQLLGSWQQALRRVRVNATNLQIAAAQVEVARAQSRQALARALPTLTGSAYVRRHLLTGEGISFADVAAGREPRRTTIPDPLTTYGAGLELRVPVFAPSAWYDHGTAKRAERSAKLDYADSQRLVLGAVAEAIVSVITAERLAEISRVSLKSSLSTLELNRRRAQLGAASAVDVLRAEQEVALTRAQVVATNEGVRSARDALGLALGSSDPWSVTPNIKLDSLAADARAVCTPVDNVEARPDVRAARSRAEVAERSADGVHWEYWPRVDFVSNLDYIEPSKNSPNRENVTWTIAGVLTWPLYDGGLRYGNRELGLAQHRLAREQLTQARRAAKIELQQANRAVQVAKANLGVSIQSRDIARKSARLSRIAFVQGQGNSFDLVDSARRLREAELDVAVKEFELVRAQIAALLSQASCNV
jgi:outer membrane protein TolC